MNKTFSSRNALSALVISLAWVGIAQTADTSDNRVDISASVLRYTQNNILISELIEEVGKLENASGAKFSELSSTLTSNDSKYSPYKNPLSRAFNFEINKELNKNPHTSFTTIADLVKKFDEVYSQHENDTLSSLTKYSATRVEYPVKDFEDAWDANVSEAAVTYHELEHDYIFLVDDLCKHPKFKNISSYPTLSQRFLLLGTTGFTIASVLAFLGQFSKLPAHAVLNVLRNNQKIAAAFAGAGALACFLTYSMRKNAYNTADGVMKKAKKTQKTETFAKPKKKLGPAEEFPLDDNKEEKQD